MNLPVLNTPAEYHDGRWKLHRQADGSSVLVVEHAQFPRAVYFDEKSSIWKELTVHPSEVRNG